MKKKRQGKPESIPLERVLLEDDAGVSPEAVEAFMTGKSNVLPLGVSTARRNYDILERENSRDEKLFAALKDTLFKNASENIRHKDGQAAKTRKPRGKGTDGRTISDLIATLAREHPEAKPRELWNHLESAIAEWADGCKLQHVGGQLSYRYSPDRGAKEYRTLTYKHFGDVLRKVRKAR